MSTADPHACTLARQTTQGREHELATAAAASAQEAQWVEVPTVPLSVMSSSALRAEEDLAYLQKTMPLLEIRSVLQYCKSLKASISTCRSGSSVQPQRKRQEQIHCWLNTQGFDCTSMLLPLAVLGTTKNRRDLAGILSGSVKPSGSLCCRLCEPLLLRDQGLLSVGSLKSSCPQYDTLILRCWTAALPGALSDRTWCSGPRRA